MATEKTFTVAGVSSRNGETKVRFGNDLASRVKGFSKGGSTVNMIELPNAMTKLEALEYISTHAEFQDADAQFTIKTKLDEKRKEAKKGEIKVAGARIKKEIKASQPESV